MCKRVDFTRALIANLPPDVLAAYRKRVDPRAKVWLEEGEARRDAKSLRKIVDQAFCSTPGERALELLGDMAFERGQFAEAISWWQLLGPAAKNNDLPALTYPDAHAAPARLAALQFLARLYSGSVGDVPSELVSYRTRFPAASGALAGQTGLYADRLDQLAARFSKGDAPPSEWSTFAGDPTRGLIIPTPSNFLEDVGELSRMGPTWRFNLWDGLRVRPGDGRINPKATQPSLKARSMAFEPLIVGDKVLVADARYLRAYDLRTGGPGEIWYDAAVHNPGLQPNLVLPAPPDIRYTLTLADDCVFGRFGLQAIKDVRANGDRDVRRNDNNESVLACVSLRPGKDGSRLRWQVRAMEKEPTVFEGAPVVRDGLVYIAATRAMGDRTITAIQCYPVDASAVSPLRWSVDVCETNEFSGQKKARNRHHLLTMAGSTLVYCSHTGAIVAVDAVSGKRLWGRRYPTRAKFQIAVPVRPGDIGQSKMEESPAEQRDLAPCLAANGRIYVAPTDSESLFCLDPATGSILWERDALAVVHLLGVGKGRLIFTTAPGDRGEHIEGERPYGLRAVDANDGSDERGWLFPESGGLVSVGRGILVGDLVLWPTSAPKAVNDGKGMRVLAVRQIDGRQPPECPTLLRNIPVGNLVWAEGCLAIADREELWVFVPPEMRIDELRKEAAQEEIPREATLALARGEIALKQPLIALSHLKHLGAGRLAAEANRQRWRALLETAHHDIEGDRSVDAPESLTKLASGEFAPPLRLEAIRRMSNWCREGGEAAQCIALYRQVLSDPALRKPRSLTRAVSR